MPSPSAVAVVTGDLLTIRLTGEIDLATATPLGDRLQNMVATSPARHVVVDLAGVDFCDAAGVRTLVSLATTATGHGGSFRLHGARPHIVWLLTTLQAAHLLAAA
ncbi:anti-anti-sigma factor [Actinoplanes tereljensis]|uniref:STAS domain-containing protein n=1 Tax=Paractinoplanes tereljensis TaxID=571912 RepID=A0A919NRJ6_9ACTN|nr:STAS domain-containing protein [Actinoplanes tereljensis]GIF22709.1 hypothetical protein Ate02nite_54390 [Actinoplanes tereljensis]